MNPQAIRSTLAMVVIALCLLLFAAAPSHAQFPPTLIANAGQGQRPEPADRWRVEFNDAAESDGIISFRLWVHDESPQHVDVAIRSGQTDNQIARATRDALALRLGARYTVELADGHAVVVTARRDAPRFTVELLRDTALDVDVEVDRD